MEAFLAERLEWTEAERREIEAPPVLTTAELAECSCPDYCERDHANE